MADQGAGRNSGQGAGKSFVQFSRGAAQRIAKVVRTVEAGDRSQPGITFDHPIQSLASPLKVATFTGSWATGTYKTVTLVGSTNTASVYNWCNATDGNGTETAHVVFGKASGTNSVLEISFDATKVATFTGSWATGTYKTVTLVGSTNTASVYNWTTPVAASAENESCERHVVFTKAFERNVLIEIEMQVSCSSCTYSLDGLDLTTLAGYVGGEPQLLGHGSNGCLQWFSVYTCATA